ncbi:MAG: hypothetical protein ACRC80_11180 [Waterburya sp.]
MNDYPNLNPYGYKIDAELGRNREGGRITWKGIKLDNQQTVVIKQFCFAQVGTTWSGYKAYEQEIKDPARGYRSPYLSFFAHRLHH